MPTPLYEIKLVCNTCKKSVPAQKAGWTDVPVPSGWGLLSGQTETHGHSSSKAIEPELACTDCLPKRASDIAKTAGSDARVCIVIERFIR